MILNTSCLCDLDVINICSGRKLGWLCDFELDTSCGKICAVFVNNTVFSFTGTKNAVRIPWEKIVCIGKDAILVDCGQDADRCGEEKCRTGKRGLFR